MDTIKKPIFHYGWIIAVCGMLMVFTTVGIIMTSFSAVRPYLAEAYNLTQGQNGLLTSIRTFANMFSLFVVGALYKKVTVRWGCTLGMAFAVIGYIIFALGDSFAYGVAAMIMMGCARTCAGMIAVSMLINAWFSKYRSTLFGICSCTSGFTTFIMPPILSNAIENHDFRYCCFLVAGILFVLTLLILIFVRDNPAQKGLMPVGYEEGYVEVKKKKAAKGVHHNYKPDKTVLILMLVVAGLSSMCYAHGDFNTLNLTTAGWEKADAARALSRYGLCLMIGKFLYGWIADHLPMRKASIIYYGAMSLAFISFMLVRNSWWTIGVATTTFIIYTLGGALPTNGLSSFAIDMSPSPEEFGKTVQQYNIMYNVCSAVFCWVAGLTADLTGYYTVAYGMCLACSVIGFILVQYCYARSAKNWKREHANDAVETAAE